MGTDHPRTERPSPHPVASNAAPRTPEHASWNMGVLGRLHLALEL